MVFTVDCLEATSEFPSLGLTFYNTSASWELFISLAQSQYLFFGFNPSS